jgi:hypothetical protein
MKRNPRFLTWSVVLSSSVLLGALISNVEAGRINIPVVTDYRGDADGLSEPVFDPEIQPGLSNKNDLASPTSPPPTTDIDTPPPGNSLYKTIGNTCVNLTSSNQNFTNIFPDFTVTTKAVTGLMEINVSSQASIGARSSHPLSTADARMWFRCQISADGGASFSDCSGMGTSSGNEGVIWLRRARFFDGTNLVFVSSTVPGSYIGYFPNTQPYKTYTIRLQARHNSTDATSTICFANTTVRY